jgi:hypothetical protein
MAKYTSGRQKNLKVGITSYSENLTSLEVIGKVGIGTTNAGGRSLYVIGNTEISGVITAITFSGNSTSASYATTAGISTNATYAGYATTAGISTNATYAGYATTAGIATNATYAGYATTAGIATEATNVIGGIASVSQLYVNGGISTLGFVTSGNIFSTGVITATKFVGSLQGNADSASSALSAGTAGSASNATNLTGGGTASANSLTISGNSTLSGVSTFGNSSIGIKIDGTTGIITSTNPGFTTVTYYGTLIGTAQVTVENVTDTTNVIGGIASVTALSVSGFSTVGILTASRIGIGTTNPTSLLWVGGDVFVTGVTTLGTVNISSGIITSSNPGFSTVTFVGNLTGTASTASFATTSFKLNNKFESELNVAYATTAGISTNATYAGYATTAGISTNATYAGYATTAGISTNATYAGYATTAGIATEATYAGYATTAGISTNATNVIGGIASVTSLFVNTTGISTLGTVKISSGIVSSTTGIAITFIGNLTGTASTASFATTAYNLQGFDFNTTTVGSAKTATDVIGGIASVTQLYVSGVSTVGVLTATRIGIGTTNPTAELFVIGNSNISGIATIGIGSTGVVIDGALGIITSSRPGITTVTYFGDGSKLTGIRGVSVESQIQTEQPVFPTLASGVGVSSIGIATTGSTALSFIPSTGSLGIGTTNPTSKLTVNGNALFGGTGIVTAVEYNGNLRIGTPTGGFKTGAVGIVTADFTKDSINDINSILGKLVPKPPTTIAGVALTVTSNTGLALATALLCNGFTPTNNAGTGVVTPTAGTSYKRNTNGTVDSVVLTQYGPGDSGTVTAFLNNTVGVGTTTLSTGSNNGTYGALVISNDKDASFSTRNTGIVSGFYEIYDVQINNLPNCPDGFNCISIMQGSNETSKTQSFWYEDGSIVSAPVLSAGTINTPSTSGHDITYSSGVPHYSESSANAFTYVLTCQNASGDMYSSNTFCTGGSATSGFQASGNKTYTSFTGGTNPPVKDFGVGTGVTTLISQTPQNTHIQLASPVSFSSYTATTPYGSNILTPTLSKTINIMGSTATTSKIDENNILISSLGSGSGNSSRTNAGSGDNPTPVTTGWDDTISVATYEATVVGGVLKHDTTNYSTGFLPSQGPSGIAPDYSTGRSGSQYFQVQIIRSAVSSFKINVTGTYAGCWVSMPTNTTWTTSLSGTNGWADMFQAYKGSGVPTTAEPGCSSGGVMTGSSGTFTCTFGSESSTNDSNNRILVRLKLTSGQSITAMSFSS